MFEPFTVTSWASASEGCRIQHSVGGSDEVTFVFGSGTDTFEFAFDAEALKNFIALGAEALAEMDAQATDELAKAAVGGVELPDGQCSA
jgi:hypothetical protein